MHRLAVASLAVIVARGPWGFGDGGEDMSGWVMEGWMILGGGLG
jgi:hypothetical protein